MSDRIEQMKKWLDSLGYQNYALTPASEDASFRRYFRLQQGDESWIVMDAPPAKEPCDRFVDIAQRLRGIRLSAPEIIHENHDDGFLVLTDFGDVSYLQVLKPENANSLYGDAKAAILQMQTRIDADDLPLYDEALLRQEMELFKEWFLEKLLGIELSPNQLGLWQMTVDTLVKSALEQPQSFVHRDFHSRNLMLIEGKNIGRNPGILDFQDAVKGPVTYDLVSLLRDCYIDWPEPQVDQWALDFYDFAVLENLQGVKASQFMRWFNLMGAQRHLKAIGIFSRLKLRDGKDQFLEDIPRTLNYLKIVGTVEMSMVGLNALINELSLSFRVKSMIR
jgi:aminoglycoside/choline kinase family phosphotransferase